jgi:hypothetical protein
MKSFLIKIASSFTAILVLLSTFSFTVEKHYCGDFLVDVSFIGSADDCGMKMETTLISKTKDCCKNEVHKIEGQDELQQSSDFKFDFKNQQFLTAFFISHKDLFIDSQSNKTNYKDFSPPEIPSDYRVLYQVFLI